MNWSSYIQAESIAYKIRLRQTLNVKIFKWKYLTDFKPLFQL